MLPPRESNSTVYIIGLIVTLITLVACDFVPSIAIVVVPFATELTIPFASTVATFELPEVNVYDSSTFVTVIFVDWPLVSVILVGDTFANSTVFVQCA